MKTVLFTIMICGSAFFAKGQQLVAQNASFADPQAKWDKTVIDLGKVKHNVPAVAEFQFTNVGGAPLVITEVKPACSCTVPNYSKDPVGPKQKGVIKAQYDAARLGQFSKTVTVHSNTEGGMEVLTFKGEVVE